jgi:hypothetical protein
MLVDALGIYAARLITAKPINAASARPLSFLRANKPACDGHC